MTNLNETNNVYKIDEVSELENFSKEKLVFDNNEFKLTIKELE
jgi:hypothetical protein